MHKLDELNAGIVRALITVHQEANEDICLEIPGPKVNVSDDSLRRMVRQEFGIDAIKICNEARERQDAILQVMKEVVGTNIHQIARITGLSSTRIWKV